MYVPPPPIVGGPTFTRSAVSASAVMSRRHHSGGRADHTPTRKVITVSLQQAVQLHTSENAWKPATLKAASSPDSTDSQLLASQVGSVQWFTFVRHSCMHLLMDVLHVNLDCPVSQ